MAKIIKKERKAYLQEARTEADKHIAFCKQASERLGYIGKTPILFWIGSIVLYLKIERPENKHIRLGEPLTIASPDFPELSADFCRFLAERGDEGYRYEPTQ